jgi:mitochondrial cardiolipin hydrolase
VRPALPLEKMRNKELSFGSASVLEDTSDMEVIFTRTSSIAEVIEVLVGTATSSIEAALYGFSSPSLADALGEAQIRRLRLRLILDANKYRETVGCQRMLTERKIPFRLAFGRDGAGGKMHHKFAVLDRKLVLTGSYNWTAASEDRNYENLLILRSPDLIQAYRAEFAALWEKSLKVPGEGF